MLFVVQFEDVYGEQPYRLPERAQHTELCRNLGDAMIRRRSVLAC